MREQGLDYFENSRRATYVQREYAIRNPREFDGYGEDCWGMTASDGPGPATIDVDGVERRFFDYRGARRPAWARRRHARALGGRGLAAVRARDRAAGDSLLRRQAST